ncbi:MAG: energy-coupling factor transporter ATPase [Fusobacteria bacterium]|nr:energy-coupling factor transporter ATPase [Fusobacteriota bacterium]
MIKISNLNHRYMKSNGKGVITLEDINLNIEKGSFVSIIGHNGSGKSTFAKHLNGLIVPQSGKIEVDGIQIKNDDNIWKIRNMVGMVFQNPDNQFIGGTIEEDIAFGLENIGVPGNEMEDRIQDAALKVGMEEYLKRPPHKLSGGQKQRSAIGAVLAMQPEYIVLDEPTSMLDPKGRQEVIEVLRKRNKEDKITIILITHYMDEVVYSDKVVVMDKGRIVISGQPKEVFKQKEMLLKIGLELPKAALLQDHLKKIGVELGDCLLTKEELVRKIWELY